MNKIKPYLYILLLFLIPMIFFHFFRNTNGNDKEKATETVKDTSLKNQKEVPPSLVIHGGAGTADPEMMSDSLKIAYKSALYEVLEVGKTMLLNGDSAHHVVIKVISIMEDDQLFNAGRGSVLTNEGTVTLDASIMTGWDKKAGAVACVENIKNPIYAAYHVLNNSPHVMLVGKGADEFAKQQGLEIVPNSYFITENAKARLKKALETDKAGTVGCVARDKYGNLAAGTSTGGMNNKKFGRVGDSPIIGAGTWADNDVCAVSCTGWGEFLIRSVAAHEVASLIKYKGHSLSKSLHEVIYNQIDKFGGNGAIIAIDKNGEIAIEGNTSTIFHAWFDKNGRQNVALSKK
ncbi:MAG TPA: isoaspartyl peptidase/L-asparaginase [Salinivirgaceae bacterium]|nr:isoaspartyl peptidase/L-asparaginase [Salinivirgaceae bacterium]